MAVTRAGGESLFHPELRPLAEKALPVRRPSTMVCGRSLSPPLRTITKVRWYSPGKKSCVERRSSGPKLPRLCQSELAKNQKLRPSPSNASHTPPMMPP